METILIIGTAHSLLLGFCLKTDDLCTGDLGDKESDRHDIPDLEYLRNGQNVIKTKKSDHGVSSINIGIPVCRQLYKTREKLARIFFNIFCQKLIYSIGYHHGVLDCV